MTPSATLNQKYAPEQQDASRFSRPTLHLKSVPEKTALFLFTTRSLTCKEHDVCNRATD